MSETWGRRLLRAKRFEIIGLIVLLLTAGGLVITTTLLHRTDVAHRVSMAMDDEAHAAIMRHDVLFSAIGSSVSDLLFLRDLNEVAAFIADPSGAKLEPLVRELQLFVKTRDAYDQISVLSREGMELVRVDRRAGSPTAAASGELQDKSDRKYYQGLRSARSGSLYVSRLDANAESGDVEDSTKPILRFGVSLGRAEAPQAYLVVSMLGAVLLDAYAAAHRNDFSRAYLLDDNGDWIRGPEPGLAWGESLPDRGSGGFRFAYPEAWDRFESEQVRQFETDRGLFTFDTIAPESLAESFAADLGFPRPSDDDSVVASDRSVDRWLAVSVVSSETLGSMRSAGIGQLVGWNVLGFLTLGTASAALARGLRRRAELIERTEQQREALASTLGRYMHKEIRDRVLRDPSRHARLGGEAQDVAVLFADIRGFTRFTETNDPEYVVSVLNRTLTELSVPLRAVDGILDKFIGDGFLAFFETRPNADAAAQRAVMAARMMQQAFRNLWSHAESKDLRDLGLGIGISAGRVVVGNVGSEESMDYTVVGDAVNVASRLEGMAKHGEVLLCGTVQSRLQADAPVELLHKAGRVRGRGRELEIYRLR